MKLKIWYEYHENKPCVFVEDLREFLKKEIEQSGHKETTVEVCLSELLALLEGEPNLTKETLENVKEARKNFKAGKGISHKTAMKRAFQKEGSK